MLNNSRDIKKFATSMRQNQKNEVARLFLAITAQWCGACHSVSDRLNKALKKPAVSASRIDETKLSELNQTLNTNIEPPHYPYFIVLNTQGSIVKILKSIDEVEDFLKTTPNKEGSNPMPVSNSRSNEGSNPMPVSKSNNEGSNPMLVSNSRANNSISKSSQIPDRSLNVGDMGEGDEDEEEEEQSLTMEMKPVSMKINSAATALPPNARVMDTITPARGSEPMSPAQGGGCLYASLASTAYQLAPPAVLLGIAAATLKKKRSTRRRR